MVICPPRFILFFIGPKATVDAGTSLLEFTNTMPTYISYTDVKFHNVLFSNPEGTASLLSDYEAAGDKIPKVSTFNRLEMRNNGIILGEKVMSYKCMTAGAGGCSAPSTSILGGMAPFVDKWHPKECTGIGSELNTSTTEGREINWCRVK